MSILNIFRNDAFSTVEMTAAVERAPFKPAGLGTLGIFEDKPIRTTALAVEERNGILTIIPTSERGTAPKPRQTEKRKMRYFEVPRLAADDTIFASELQGIREFGEETVLMQIQAEVARRVAGPTGLTSNIEYTWERHRLGAVQGLLLDADGSVLYDWFDEFGVVKPAAIAFDLKGANTKGTLRKKCAAVVRAMQRASQGAWTPNTRVHAICGDAFWDDFVSHDDVVQTYTNWNAAVELRGGTAFASMPFGDIDWQNYRGSDDNSEIAVAPDEVKFFPVGAPGVFQRALSPGESFQWINTLGKPIYIQMITDKDRDQWVKAEAYSYPLHICTRPEMLQSGKRGA
ncbi:major capsid protein [Roseomonas xinghualingensis]|uniref:major capsid protein n=1 Tax=Roseomonas xinghualingensis TaxID=2986475 RepID=UPI0021F20EAB|nr:major capsid protein [Roseomonas sp. SXEYE001]MCV4206915.1 major capsid protein [Roseomonas sp. SXEYE001]